MLARIRETAQQLTQLAQSLRDDYAEREIVKVQEQIAPLELRIAVNPHEVIDECVTLRVRLSQIQAGFVREIGTGSGVPVI